MTAYGLGIRVYTDEDVDARLAIQLRNQGYDIISASDVGNVHIQQNQSPLDDNFQLDFATKDRRAILVHNYADYRRLDSDFRSQGRTHHGIIMAAHLPLGELVRRTRLHLDTRTPQEQHNMIWFLPS